MSRILTLDSGRVMVVTDLHGDYPAYCRYRDLFLALRASAEADVLLFGGDLIHSEDAADPDGSLEIILDVLRLKQELGDRLIVLLGNHELPHLYGVTLAKGHAIYTPRFEAAMGRHRSDILAFFDGLPFFVRTRAGVTLTHAGASRAAADPASFQTLADYSHTAELAKVDELLNRQDRDALRAGIAKFNGKTYEALVVDYLGPDALTPERYDELLRGMYLNSLSEPFQDLWEATMNKNEREYGLERYTAYLKDFLGNMSQGYVEQHTVVSGHIMVRGGHAVIADWQLRLASWAHAHPPEAGEYLLFDASKPLNWVGDVEQELRHISGNEGNGGNKGN